MWAASFKSLYQKRPHLRPRSRALLPDGALQIQH